MGEIKQNFDVILCFFSVKDIDQIPHSYWKRFYKFYIRGKLDKSMIPEQNIILSNLSWEQNLVKSNVDTFLRLMTAKNVSLRNNNF
jgi:hypothetical protein